MLSFENAVSPYEKCQTEMNDAITILRTQLIVTVFKLAGDLANRRKVHHFFYPYNEK